MANNIWDMAWAQILALRYWRALRYWFGLRYSLEILARFEILAWDICLRQVEIFARQVEILAFWDIGNFKASWDISKASWDIGFLRYCETRGKLRYSLYLKRNEDLVTIPQNPAAQGLPDSSGTRWGGGNGRGNLSNKGKFEQKLGNKGKFWAKPAE